MGIKQRSTLGVMRNDTEHGCATDPWVGRKLGQNGEKSKGDRSTDIKIASGHCHRVFRPKRAVLFC